MLILLSLLLLVGCKDKAQSSTHTHIQSQVEHVIIDESKLMDSFSEYKQYKTELEKKSHEYQEQVAVIQKFEKQSEEKMTEIYKKILDHKKNNPDKLPAAQKAFQTERDKLAKEYQKQHTVLQKLKDEITLLEAQMEKCVHTNQERIVIALKKIVGDRKVIVWGLPSSRMLLVHPELDLTDQMITNIHK